MNLERKVKKPSFLGRLKHHQKENERIRNKIKSYSEKEQTAYYEGYGDAILHAERLHIYEGEK